MLKNGCVTMPYVGWLANITLLKSIGSQWVTMRIVTVICLALCALELVFLHKNPTGIRKSIVRQMPGILVCLVGLCTIAVYAIRKITGEEPSMETSPFLNLFLTPDTRMALLTAILFLIVGGVLSLFAIGSRRGANIAHAITAPAAVMSYLVPVSYLLGVQSLHGWYQVPVALHWGGNFLEFSSISTLSLVFVRFNPQS